MVLEWIMETLTFPLHPIKQITVHVSCCYDRGYTVMPAYTFQYKWIANKTRFISDPAFDIKGRNLAVAFQRMALSRLKHFALTKCHEWWYLTFFFSSRTSWQYHLRGFFFFILLKKILFISPTFVCTFNLHIKEIPSGPALHIYIWLVTLNEHVKNGRIFFFECARTT